MKVIVIGSRGQLGTDLVETLSARPSFAVTGLTHQEIEVSDPSAQMTIANLKPDAVVNTAAFHKTDLCEDEPDKAFRVNSIGAYNVSKACAEVGAIHAYVSTDYVFSGDKHEPYTEEDTPDPINIYGASKLAGEKITTAYSQKHYVLRSSSLFGMAGASGKGGNFIETIIRKASAIEEIKVVDDVTMSPTNTKDLAKAISGIVEQNLPFGVYHVANSGFCTWWEFAKEITAMAGYDSDVNRTNSMEYKTKARRPRMSALASTKLTNGRIRMQPWKDALRDYLRAKGHLRQ